ncbi:MAG: glycosyltransferase [Candidatus Omnitrophica bacterium]|nr:glycosyltransferase [Candidatus Omnitrophota bacterium]
MKKVLIITYHFPPRPGVAGLRLRGLAKYLPRFGWEPIILTPKLPGPSGLSCRVIETKHKGDFSSWIKRRMGFNPDLRLDEQPGRPFVIPASKDSWLPKFMEYVYGMINYPDEQKNWIPLAVQAGEDFLAKERVDALLTSSHPASCHLIAYALKKKFHIPWGADLRDLWTQNHYYQYGRIRKFFEEKLEKRTFNEADVLFTVSEPLADLLRTFHGKTTVAVPNGFDPEETFTGTLPTTKDFTIAHTGRLYDGKRDPAILFSVMQQLIKEKKLDPQRVRLNFWGSKNAWLEREIEKYNLGGIACQCGMINRSEVLAKQRESQLLLLLTWMNPKENGVYTGKIFEYLISQRPILAIGAAGPHVVRQLLEKTKAGYFASDETTLRQIILQCWEEYLRNGRVAYQGITDEINQYSHMEMAKKFAEKLAVISR